MIQAPSDINTLKLFESISCLIGVAILSWIIVWMSRTIHKMSGESCGVVDAAAQENQAICAFISLAFLTVGREGSETMIIQSGLTKGAMPAKVMIGVALG